MTGRFKRYLNKKKKCMHSIKKYDLADIWPHKTMHWMLTIHSILTWRFRHYTASKNMYLWPLGSTTKIYTCNGKKNVWVLYAVITYYSCSWSLYEPHLFVIQLLIQFAGDSFLLAFRHFDCFPPCFFNFHARSWFAVRSLVYIAAWAR